MKNFYTSYVVGGLGNQMFQIAHALCEGKKHNVEVKFKPESNGHLQGNNMSTYVDNILKKLKFERFSEYLIHINESKFTYHELNYPINENVEFYGYYQSSKYFYGYEDFVKEIFEPSEDIKKYLIENYPNIKEDNTLSIHVRRGDYLINPHIHPTVGLEYINRALEIIGDYSYVFIFSDDLQWVKENLKIKNSIFVENLKDYEELWLMSLCKNNIISNSSFSWWGSFLNKNENKKVVSPSIWFGQGGPDFKDIYEKNWQIIKVENKNGVLC
jgi:hypothetical protein